MSTSCKVRCFYFFVLNAAIRMTISSSTAPTSTIPKPLDVSHIQIVAAQTILRFPSILTLLISLSLVAGTAWCSRWNQIRTRSACFRDLFFDEFYTLVIEKIASIPASLYYGRVQQTGSCQSKIRTPAQSDICVNERSGKSFLSSSTTK